MKFETKKRFGKMLEELNLVKPPKEGCLNIIWMSFSNPEKFEIDFNQPLVSIWHKAVILNDEVGLYFSDGKVWEFSTPGGLILCLVQAGGISNPTREFLNMVGIKK